MSQMISAPTRLTKSPPTWSRRLCLVVVVDLLLLTAAHEGGFGALVVNVGPELLQVGEGRLLGLFNGNIDFLLGGLVDGLYVSYVPLVNTTT